MTNLQQLALRIEGAEGPSRELDGLIFEACDDLAEWCKGPNGWAGYLPIRESDPPSLQSLDAYLEAHAPAYTASLDAALSLVPEGWPSVCVGTTDDGRGYAAIAGNDGHMMAEDPDEFYAEATAATPALALAAAALRAIDKENCDGLR